MLLPSLIQSCLVKHVARKWRLQWQGLLWKLMAPNPDNQRKRFHVFFQTITKHKYMHTVNHFKSPVFKRLGIFCLTLTMWTSFLSLFHLVADERWQVWVIWPITVVLHTYWVIFKEHAHINRLISKRRYPCLVGLKKYWFQKWKIFQITSIFRYFKIMTTNT